MKELTINHLFSILLAALPTFVFCQHSSNITLKYATTSSKDSVCSNDLVNHPESGRRPAIFLTNLNLATAKFEVPVNCDSATFRQCIDLGEATFSYDASFSQAIFNSSSNFSKVHFKKCAYLDATYFADAFFQSTYFTEMGEFSSSNFHKLADFSRSTFEGGIDIEGATFLGNVLFKEADFNNEAYFNNCRFSKEFNFSTATFNKTVDFSNAHFGSKLDLQSLDLGHSSRLIFDDTHLPDTIDLSHNSDIPNEIDLSVADFSTDRPRSIMVNLYKTDISKLKLNYINFSLYFPRHNGKDILLEEKEVIYESLLANFKIRGQQESFKLLDIEYQTFKWRNSWARLLIWLPEYWWNFGYNKEYIFIWTILFIIALTTISYFYIYFLNVRVYRMDNIDEASLNKWKHTLSLNDAGNRLWYSFIYTSSIFFRLTLKTEKLNFNNKFGISYVLIVYTLGLICLAYIANFVIQR